MQKILIFFSIFAVQAFAADSLRELDLSKLNLSEKEIPRSLVSSRGWRIAENYFADQGSIKVKAEMVAKSGRLSVYRTDQALPKNSLPVIYNTRYHQLAIVTGELLIRLKNSDASEALCNDFALVCESASVLVARPSEPGLQKLLETGSKLANDPRVQVIQLNLATNHWVPW